ncbi:MAG: D-alanyl-D-alanine carboxypeptidase [Oscillospiraceae bacterium]|nr:D-alanyl-D-alanine carboxypeptidase [Oscillospiraceae bacterium]
MKKIFTAAFLLVAVVLSSVFGAFALNTSSADTATQTNSSSTEQDAKVDTKKLTDISSILNTVGTNVSVSADSAVLYCVNNGTVIFAKNPNRKMKMASTTKVMTALLALEAAAADDKIVTFTQEMVAEGSSMYLKVGDKVKLSDLAVGMLLCSGNDAANAAAIGIAGSKESFAVMMNKRAEQIGMKNTNFVTPSGLDDEQHYSTAYDMALLFAYAMENETFTEISIKKTARVEFASPQGKANTYSNHNKLLSRYENCIGGKTGFTKAAGRCLVSAAEKNNLRYVAVTLKASDDWNDHAAMFDFGFDSLAVIRCSDTQTEFATNVVGGTADTTALVSPNSIDFVVTKDKAADIERTVYIPKFIYAPVRQDVQVGRVVYKLGGKFLAQSKILSAEEIEYKE